MRHRAFTIFAAAAVAAGTFLVAPHALANSGETATMRVPAVPPSIPNDAPLVHINELQRIAGENGGNRAHGTPGYTASATYVYDTLVAAGFQTTQQPFTHNGGAGSNIIAEWPQGDANDVVMAGAHLDSVRAGPGLNDNGSGSSALLEIALTVARQNLKTNKRLRFAWWGAEEVGLVGSKKYVASLSGADKGKIKAYYNFDMVGTKKVTKWGVYTDGDASLAAIIKRHFAAKNVPTVNLNVNGRSDHAAFRGFTKASGFISEDSLGRLDPCYHQACDKASNLGLAPLAVATNLIAGILWEQAGAQREVSAPRT